MKTQQNRSLSNIFIRILLVTLLLAVLATAFWGYLQPEMMLDLANRFVLC